MQSLCKTTQEGRLKWLRRPPRSAGACAPAACRLPIDGPGSLQRLFAKFRQLSDVLMKKLLVVLVLLVVGVCIGVAEWGAAPEPHGRMDHMPTSVERSSGSQSLTKEVSEVVRVLRQPTSEGPDGQRVPVGAPVVVGEYTHLGPLDESVRNGMIANCRQQIDNYKMQLGRPRGSGSADLLCEADLLLSIARTEKEEKALLDGRYITTAPGAPAPPLGIAGAEVVSTGGMVNGKYVNLTFVFPFADDTHLRDAHAYRQAIQAFDDSERARAFNALPDSERLRLADEIASLWRKQGITPQEVAYIHELIGRDVVLHPASGTVSIKR